MGLMSSVDQGQVDHMRRGEIGNNTHEEDATERKERSGGGGSGSCTGEEQQGMTGGRRLTQHAQGKAQTKAHFGEHRVAVVVCRRRRRSGGEGWHVHGCFVVVVVEKRRGGVFGVIVGGAKNQNLTE